MHFWLQQFILFLAVGITAGCEQEPRDLTPTRVPAAPALLAPIAFTGFSVVGPVTPAGARQLMQATCKLGSDDPDAYQFLSLTAGTNQIRLRTRSIAEYLAARRKGAIPETTFDMAMDSFFDRASAALLFLRQAVPAKKDLLNNSPLANLPVSFLDWTGDNERIALQHDTALGMTLADYRHLKRIFSWRQPGALWAAFSQSGLDYSIETVAGGDFNHDGFQDRLLFEFVHYHDGSGFHYQPFWITRTNPHSSRIILREFPLPGEIPASQPSIPSSP
jgi:hypothetical protein